MTGDRHPALPDPSSDGAIAAEVLSPAEQRALRSVPDQRSEGDDLERVLAAVTSPLRWPALTAAELGAEHFDIKPETLAKVRAAKERLRELNRGKRAAAAVRKAARYERAGLEVPAKLKRALPPAATPNPWDAAIERAHERQAQLAAKTPERHWTPAMRAAVERAGRKRDAR